MFMWCKITNSLLWTKLKHDKFKEAHTVSHNYMAFLSDITLKKLLVLFHIPFAYFQKLLWRFDEQFSFYSGSVTLTIKYSLKVRFYEKVTLKKRLTPANLWHAKRKGVIVWDAVSCKIMRSFISNAYLIRKFLPLREST